MTEDRDCDHPSSDHSASTSAATDSSPEERYHKIFHYNNDTVMIVDRTPYDDFILEEWVREPT